MKYLIILGVGAVIVAGAFLYVVFGPTSSDTVPVTTNGTGSEVPTEESETSTAVEPFSGAGTLAELMGRGQSLECTISYQVENTPAVEGTYFVHDGRVRGDFVTNVPEMGGDVLSSIIMADGEVYSWSDINGQMYGVKVVVPANEMDATTPETIRTPIPDGAAVSYDCRPWTAIDNSIFEPPSAVLFQDMSQMLEGGMEYGTIYSEGEGF